MARFSVTDPRLNDQRVSPNIALERVLPFSRSSQLRIYFAFKCVSMFDQDQTFSPNVLPYEQTFNRLATYPNKT